MTQIRQIDDYNISVDDEVHHISLMARTSKSDVIIERKGAVNEVVCRVPFEEIEFITGMETKKFDTATEAAIVLNNLFKNFNTGGDNPLTPTDEYERGYNAGKAAIIAGQSDANITPGDVLIGKIGYSDENTKVVGALNLLPQPVDEPHNILHVDINGAILSDRSCATGSNVVQPATPVNDFLTFVEWTHTHAELSNIQPRLSERGQFIGGDEIVGACYKTNDDKVHIFVKTDPAINTNRTVSLYFHNTGQTTTINIDWGDGFTESVNLTGATLVRSRNYAVDGEYHITAWSNDNITFGMGNGNASTPIVTTGKEGVTKIYFSDNCQLKAFGCNGMVNLEEVSLSTIQPIGVNFFQNCNRLKALCLPRINTVFYDYLLQNAYRVGYVAIPPTVTELGQYSAALTVSIDKLVIPRGIVDIPDNFVNGGAAKNYVTDPLKTFGNSAFNSSFLATGLNFANEITAHGTNTFNNCYGSKLTDLKVLFISNVTNALFWLYQLHGRLEIDGTVPISISALNQLHNLDELVIGENVTSIVGSIVSPELLSIEFKSITPPTLGNASYLSAMNKLGTIWVPDEALEVYKTTTNYTASAKYFKPVSEKP